MTRDDPDINDVRAALQEGITDSFRYGLGVAIYTLTHYRHHHPALIDHIIQDLRAKSLRAADDRSSS